jgi:hypothetical protein
MKTLPGIKTALFFILVFAVGLAVYAGPKKTNVWDKKHKLLVQFGWTETTPPELNPAPHSVSDIEKHLTETNKSAKYKLQHYVDSKPDGEPVGDLVACLPPPTPAPTSAAAPQPGPSGTPSGAKTQSVGLVQFDDPTAAGDFIVWVNDTAAVPAKGSSKAKGKK